MTKSYTSISSLEQGQAGVYRVLSELILRGHCPYVPSADTGVDILLESGLRIQVKSTRRESAHWRLSPGTFSFSLCGAKSIRKGGVYVRPARVFSDFCDFLVLWAIEPDRFWIVPAQVLNGRHTAVISSTKQWRDLDRAQIEAGRAQGLSDLEIAKHANVSLATLKRRLTTYQTPKRAFTDLPQYENRWDLITGALATLHEATTIVEPSSTVVDAIIDRDRFLKDQ